jgi:hypothetical protein
MEVNPQVQKWLKEEKEVKFTGTFGNSVYGKQKYISTRFHYFFLSMENMYIRMSHEISNFIISAQFILRQTKAKNRCFC